MAWGGTCAAAHVLHTIWTETTLWAPPTTKASQTTNCHVPLAALLLGNSKKTSAAQARCRSPKPETFPCAESRPTRGPQCEIPLQQSAPVTECPFQRSATG